MLARLFPRVSFCDRVGDAIEVGCTLLREAPSIEVSEIEMTKEYDEAGAGATLGHFEETRDDLLSPWAAFSATGLSAHHVESRRTTFTLVVSRTGGAVNCCWGQWHQPMNRSTAAASRCT